MSPYVFQILLWLWLEFVSVLEPRDTSNARLGFFIFSRPAYFWMWNFVSGDKARSALYRKTKLHIQKCNTCRDIQSEILIVYNSIYYTLIYPSCLTSNPGMFFFMAEPLLATNVIYSRSDEVLLRFGSWYTASLLYKLVVYQVPNLKSISVLYKYGTFVGMSGCRDKRPGTY
jgi:hypothetical protein